MPIARKIPPLPPTDVPIVDPRTGYMSLEWRRFFDALLAALNEIRSAIP